MPKEDILERLESILEIFARMDGYLKVDDGGGSIEQHLIYPDSKALPIHFIKFSDDGSLID